MNTPTPSRPDTADAYRVVYVNRSRPSEKRAGLVQALQTMAAVRELGLDICMYLPPWPGPETMEAKLAEFGIHDALDIRLTTFLHHRWKRWKTFKPFVAVHRRTLLRADAVYTRWPDLSLTLARAGIRNSLEIHNTHELEKKGTLGAVVDAHRKGLIHWLVPTLRNAADFLAHAGADPTRICVAPNGANLEAFASVPPFDPSSLDRAHVVYAGTLDLARGMTVLSAIAASGAAQVTLVGAQKEGITEIPGLHVRPRVPHRDVPALYGESNLVVLPYQRQLVHVDSVCPIKLFEAMAAGRPIIASDLPTIRELVEHMKTAILVDPDDTDAWIAAVNLLKNDRALAARLAAAGRVAAAGFTWRRRAEHIARTLGWRLPA